MNWNFDEKHLEIAKVLVEEIRYKQNIFYNDLRKQVGITEEKMRNLWWYLGDLSSFCNYYEMPLISAMVINMTTGFSGGDTNIGFYGLYRDLKGIEVKNDNQKITIFNEEWKLIKEYDDWGRLIKLLEEEIFPTPKPISIIKKKRPTLLGRLNIDKSKDEDVEFIEVDEFADIEDIVIEEGKYIERLTKAKKRNPKARKRKIEQFKKDNYGKVFCEVCKEDEEAVLDVHHDNVEVCDMEESHLTKLSDLRVLCSNCHRRVHGYKISVEELKDKLK